MIDEISYFIQKKSNYLAFFINSKLKNVKKSKLNNWLNSTLKCNAKTRCESSGTAVGSALFPPTKMRSINERLQSAHAGKKIRNLFFA